jgi:hypothetical protein
MDKLVRVIAVSVVLFFVVLGLVIGSRMDQNTIALLGGTTIGLLIAAPCAAIVTYLAVRSRDESSAPRTTHTPTYYVMPQAGAPTLPALPTQQHFLPITSPTHRQTPESFVLPPQRKFYLIGGGGEVNELLPEDGGTENIGGLASWENVQ